MEEVVMIRDNLRIDPQLHIWGWEIPVYLFLGGLAAGVMVLSAMMALRRLRQDEASAEEPSRWARWVPFAAPLLISFGMLALMLDLEYKTHVFRFYTVLRLGSPMSWGAWILVGIYPATLLLGLANLRPAEIEALTRFKPIAALRLGRLLDGLRAFGQRHLRGLLWANLCLGVALGIYTGILLATLGLARPAWNSALLGPLFLVSGVSTGAALMMLLPIAHSEHGLLRRWDIWAVVLELALLALFFIGLGAAGEQGREAVELFFGGRYTALFWALVVVAGLVVPLIIELIESRRGLRPTALAPVLLLAGGLSLRWILVAAGQA
jgi:formate-dependent nitrite reductase membrane component NrfD